MNRIGSHHRGSEHQSLIYGAHTGDQRQDHERQHDVHHANMHSERAWKKADRLSLATKHRDRANDDIVEHTLPLKHDHPRVRPDHNARPQRYDDKSCDDLQAPATRMRHGVGDRVGNQQAQNRNDSRRLYGVPDDTQINGAFQKLAVIGRSELRIGNTAHDDLDDRPEKKGSKKQRGRHEQPCVAGGYSPAAAFICLSGFRQSAIASLSSAKTGRQHCCRHLQHATREAKRNVRIS